MSIIDLTMPIADHFRWPVERSLKSSFETGDMAQVTHMGWAVHGFTHVDAPRHMFPEGPTTSDTELEQIVGQAAVVNLSGIAPETPITEKQIRAAGQHIRPGDIVVMKTRWDEVEPHQTPEFWTRAPYMSRAAAKWLRAQNIRAIAFDFPQDYPIRQLLSGERAPLDEFVTHDILLRDGIILIEYICNTGMLTADRVSFFALPLKIPEADGAPARVIAIQ